MVVVDLQIADVALLTLDAVVIVVTCEAAHRKGIALEDLQMMIVLLVVVVAVAEVVTHRQGIVLEDLPTMTVHHGIVVVVAATVHQMAGVATQVVLQEADHKAKEVVRLPAAVHLVDQEVVVAAVLATVVHAHVVEAPLARAVAAEQVPAPVAIQAAGVVKSHNHKSKNRVFRLYFLIPLFKLKYMKQKNITKIPPGPEDRKKKQSPLEKFFTDQLKDMYYAEQLLIKALAEMKNAATTEELEDAFEDHRKQTERHVKRLEKVFQMIGHEAEAKKCEAMDGLIKEAKSIINETKTGSMTRDAALIIAAQKVEHYEIATYGGLVQLAITMGKHRAAGLLDKTLKEEEETDHNLTEIAEGCINFEAEEEEARISSSSSKRKKEVEEEEPEAVVM